MGVARGFLLLLSTAAFAAGLAMLLRGDQVSEAILKTGNKAVLNVLTQYNFVLGGFLVFVSALLCTAAAAVNASILRSLGAGALSTAAAFGWSLYQSKEHSASNHMNPTFMTAGTGVFAVIGVLAFLLPSGTVKVVRKRE